MIGELHHALEPETACAVQNKWCFSAYSLGATIVELEGTLTGWGQAEELFAPASMGRIGLRAAISELECLGREKREFFVTSLTEVPQGVQRGAPHQWVQLLESLVR